MAEPWLVRVVGHNPRHWLYMTAGWSLGWITGDLIFHRYISALLQAAVTALLIPMVLRVIRAECGVVQRSDGRRCKTVGPATKWFSFTRTACGEHAKICGVKKGASVTCLACLAK